MPMRSQRLPPELARARPLLEQAQYPVTPMEGYSVTEAASVLGVPTERVWELLARGVLAGTPDGETGMRVHLQPRASVVPGAPAPDSTRHANGADDRERGREPEGSPFRELLSEFRNLTERYGQALLALGEARGEVASLRSRVDLLEARIDLRLPSPMPQPATPAPSSWRAEPAIVEPPAEPEADRRTRRRRSRGQHHATDEFAEALARADDPSPAELPGGAEAAAAIAALRAETVRERPVADVLLPHEPPAAEPIPAVEPEGDAVPLSAAEPSMREPGPGVDTLAPSIATPSTRGAVGDLAQWPEEHASTADEAPDEAPVEAAGEMPGDVPAEAPGVASVEAAWDRDRYTTTIGAPDWIPEAPTEVPAGPPAPETAEDDWSSVLGGWEPRGAAGDMTGFDMSGFEEWPDERVGGHGPSGAAGPWPAADAAPVANEASKPPVAETRPPSQIEAASEMEVAAAGPEAEGEAQAPAPSLGRPPESVASPLEPPSLSPSVPRPSPIAGTGSAGSGTAPSTASRAYRRLRRIFPG